MHTEAIHNRSETDYRRVLDMHEILPPEDLHRRIADRYSISGQDLTDLASGDKTVESPVEISADRGLFEHSTATYLDAAEEDRARADRYLYYECHTAAFEAVGHRGHAEKLTYGIDQAGGDAFITPGKQFGETYLMDMAHSTYTWRARLSFIEWYNNEAIAELTRRGDLSDFVVVEHSLFPYHAEASQAEAVGYNPETYKSFIRASYTDEAATERTIETLSYTDMLPADVQLLRTYFGLEQSVTADAESILAQPLLIPKAWYNEHDGIGGLARLVDQIKQQRDGQTYRFGEVVEEPVEPHVYSQVATVSVERKQQAEPVIREFMAEIIGLAKDARAGLVSPQVRREQTGKLILKYRMKLLQNDLQLAEEQYGFEVAASLDYLNHLEAEGRTGDAGLLEQSLQDQFGTAYICGMAVRVNENGDAVNDNGEVEHCPELKDGQSVTCPGCKKTVKVIVEKKERLYCPRQECTLSKSGGKWAIKVTEPAKAVPPPEPSHQGQPAMEHAAQQLSADPTLAPEQPQQDHQTQSLEHRQGGVNQQSDRIPEKLGAVAVSA